MDHARLATPLTTALVAVVALEVASIAHTPSVIDDQPASAAEAVVLDDPTLSRAIGATIGAPGEVDWYRMELAAGDLLVVGMTAPDAQGGIPATFTLVGPGLPPAATAGPDALSLAREAGAEGAIAFEPDSDPPREVHGGLGFIDYGSIRLQVPVDGTYHVAVEAVDPGATGKYVFAPGVREEFGAEAIAGMLDLVEFFAAPWPPQG
ncbi:MAG: hypothetical protein AB1Z67_09500 [Candidatus Limnocylindrales bacterium]